jgi:hypothetical protein
MAHIVTCIYCKKRFDRDKYPTIRVSNRRYAHKECAESENQKLQKEEADKIALEKYILKLLKEDFISPRVRKQLNTFVEDYNYTYSGIHKSLVYFYEIKGNPVEKANGGIGIVPYVYKDAYTYYYSLWEAKQKNEHKVIQDYVPQEVVVKINSPERKIRKRKLFSFLDEEEV